MDVDPVNRSITLLLDWPVAEGKAEQSLVVLSRMRDDVRRKTILLLLLVEGLLSLGGLVPVEAAVLLDLLVFSELVQSGLPDRDDVLEHVPEDTLGERSGRQRAVVGPAALVVQALDELRQVKLISGSTFLVILTKGIEELVMEVVVRVEVGVGHHFEEEAEHSVRELRTALLVSKKLRIKAVHDVQLEVKHLTVDGMLGWRVHVSLHSIEPGWLFIQVFIEQTDCLRLHVVLLLLQNELVLLSHLVVLLDGDWVDGVVIEFELIVLEVLENLDVRIQVDRRLLVADAW